MGTGSYLRDEYIYKPTSIHVCSLGRYSGMPWGIALLGTPSTSSAAWPSNNLAIYVPLNMPVHFTVARFMVANGSNITGSVDVGLYDSGGTRLLSTGTTARASASAVQYIDVTNQVFQRGHYYLGLVGSSTTGTYLQAAFTTASRARSFGPLQEALGSTVLPTTMTPVAFTGTSIFQFGFTQSDTL